MLLYYYRPPTDDWMVIEGKSRVVQKRRPSRDHALYTERGMWAYDMEVFPDFVSIVFVNIQDMTDVRTFYSWKGENYADVIDGVRRFVEMYCATLVGYNSLDYDDVMLRYWLSGASHEEMYALSTEIVTGNKWHDRLWQYFRWIDDDWHSLDPMSLLDLHKIGVGLKQAAIVIGWPEIQDLPKDPTARVFRSEIDSILRYNVNDAQITAALLYEVWELYLSRRELSQLYTMDLMNSSDSKAATQILGQIYSRRTGVPLRSFKKMRSYRTTIEVRDCIGKNIEFETDEMNEFLEMLQGQVLYNEDDYKFKYTLQIGETTYEFGVGGLHSKDDPGNFKTTKDTYIIDADVSSFYPYIMIYNGIRPEHLGEAFSLIFREMTEERIKAKRGKTPEDAIKAKGLKITINSVFGKMGNQHFWTYDPQAFMSVTISGQLYLLDLIEKLHMAGIVVISANTDGITCRVHVDQISTYYRVCGKWANRTRFNLEYAIYEWYYRNSINNYMAKEAGGKIKHKGDFDTSFDLRTGHRMPVVYGAVIEYFLNGTQPLDYLKSQTSIHPFILAFKTDRKFKIAFRHLDGMNVKDSYLQKHSRFIATNGGGVAIKVNPTTGKEQFLPNLKQQNVRVVNSITCWETNAYDIDFDFYAREAWKVINKIQPAQMGLFGG